MFQQPKTRGVRFELETLTTCAMNLPCYLNGWPKKVEAADLQISHNTLVCRED